jgi:hypothetical protein
LGFIGAGWLISSAYSDWLEHPFATTISTRPIDDLDFPTVTVCPPKGSHTALNYDLMKADNNSLTDQQQENLHKTVFELFTETFHFHQVDRVLTTLNKESVKQIYAGSQTAPITYHDS